MSCLPDIVEELRQAFRSNGMSEEQVDKLETFLYHNWKQIQEETKARITLPMRFGKHEKIIIQIALFECERMSSHFLMDLSNAMIHIGYKVYEVRKNRIRQFIEYIKKHYQSSSQLNQFSLPSRVVSNDYATPPEGACASTPTVQFNAVIPALPSINDDAESQALFARIGTPFPLTGTSGNYSIPLSLSNPNGTTYPLTAVSDNSPVSSLLLYPNGETSSKDISISLSPSSSQHSLLASDLDSLSEITNVSDPDALLYCDPFLDSSE